VTGSRHCVDSEPPPTRLDAEWRIIRGVRTRVATAPIAAAGLIAGYSVAVASGSRPLGGAVLAGCGLACVAIWIRRDGRRKAAMLTIAGLAAFVLSHLLGLIIGPWPSVLVVAAVTGALCWRASDSRHMSQKQLSAGARAGS
jgi:hypothetical protein